jgi:hypothetical protein
MLVTAYKNSQLVSSVHRPNLFRYNDQISKNKILKKLLSRKKNSRKSIISKKAALTKETEEYVKPCNRSPRKIECLICLIVNSSVKS